MRQTTSRTHIHLLFLSRLKAFDLASRRSATTPHTRLHRVHVGPSLSKLVILVSWTIYLVRMNRLTDFNFPGPRSLSVSIDSPHSYYSDFEPASVGPASGYESGEDAPELRTLQQGGYDADESDFDDDEDDAYDWDFRPESNGTSLITSPTPTSPIRFVPSLFPHHRTLRPSIPYRPLKKPDTYRELWDAAHTADARGQHWLAARLLPERFPMFWSPSARSWADEVEEEMPREALETKLIGHGRLVRTGEELGSPR